MDLHLLAQELIDRHTRRTAHMSHVLRGTSQGAYRQGVQDCLDLIKRTALADAQVPQPQPAISGPLAVQPSHSAVEAE